MAETTYTVVGMTCDHCVRSVTNEVSKLPGVTDVDADLATGRVRVLSTGALDEQEVTAAVEEAGYEVAP